MTRDDFEAQARRDGYELLERSMQPLFHAPEHAHDFDVRLLIVEGEFTLSFGDERRTLRPGDTCALERGRKHAEDVGPAGVRYLVGRRRG